MFKHKKLIIILLSVIFFLTALTFYANKVLFPTIIRKIAIEQAKSFLKRDVTIESIRFNWVKGFIVDQVTIYQADNTKKVFVQFDRLSLGIVFIPGIKEHTLSIPFVTVDNPSIHLIKTGATTWNFSDLLNQPAPSNDKPSNIKVSLGGVNINNGKILLDDQSRKPAFSERFDNINLAMSLSYQGINFDFTTDIPSKKGSLAAKGSYMPIDNSANAHLRLRNIDTASYLSLFPLEGITLTSGVIDDINVDIKYTNHNNVSVKGDVLLKKFDVTTQGVHVATSINARNLDVTYANGPVTAKGDLTTSALNLELPGLSIALPNGLTIKANDASVNRDDIVFDGSVRAKQAGIKMSAQGNYAGDINLESIKLRKDKSGIQLVGSILADNIDAILNAQHAQLTTLSIKPLVLTIDPANNIDLQGDIKADKIAFTQPGQQFNGSLTLTDLKTTFNPTGNIQLTTKASLEDYAVTIDKLLTANGNLRANKLMLKLTNGVLKLSTDSEITKGKITLPENKIIDVSPQVELNLEGPLNDLTKLDYSGSITFADAKVSGFPYTPLDGIGLDADFKTNSATINALTVNILESSLRASGTINNFTKPALKINAEANDINLGLVKNYIPEIFKQYGLSVDGLASLKIKFDGITADPLAGDIQALITLNKVNASSSTFNQNVKNVSGIIEATPNSLLWRDFKGNYLGQNYALTGKLTDFKNPKVTTTLDGADVTLKADLSKEGDVLTINQLTGKYLKINFDTKGTVNLPAQGNPIVNLTASSTFGIEDILPLIPQEQQKAITDLKPSGQLTINTTVKGDVKEWQKLNSQTKIESPLVTVMGYKINNLKIDAKQADGKINSTTIDANIYDGTAHIVASLDLLDKSMPFDVALNLDAVDLSKLKMDIPNLSAENIKGKFYLTSIAKGDATKPADLTAKGSVAIRDGFLAEFKFFKGLLGILNDALRLGQVMITDVDGNFTIEKQKLSTDSLRLHSPTIVLLTSGWVGFDQMCDLKVTVDLSSGIVPSIAEDVLRSLEVRIYDKISNPKFEKKISMPQVINTIIKTIGIFQ